MDEERPLIYAWRKDNTRIHDRSTSDRIHERLTKDIESILDERNKIITFHLYVEYWLNKILEKSSLINKKEIDTTSFYKKLDALWNNKIIDNTTFENITLVNQIRNKFAHVLEIEKIKVEIQKLINKFQVDPYFFTTDRDRFKAICIQTLFLLEAIYNNDGKPINLGHPSTEIKSELLEKGQIFWQSCHILSVEEPSPYEEEFRLKCPLCMEGEIYRFKDNTPGFKDCSFQSCNVCGLDGDGSYLYLNTAEDKYKT